MKRILQDYLTLPVYLVSEHELKNGNLSVRIHVDPFQEPIEGRIPSIDAPYAAVMQTRDYPAVDFYIEISRNLLNDLERSYPTPNNARDEHGFFDTDVYERKAQEYRKLHNEYLNGLARTIVGLWQREVGK